MRSSPVAGSGQMSAFVLLPLLGTPLSAWAHGGHVLDLVSAFMEPLAGWDHLLMALVFLGVLGVGARMILKARSRAPRDMSKDQP